MKKRADVEGLSELSTRSGIGEGIIVAKDSEVSEVMVSLVE
jgi:hypothetical protein